ncbi:MAG: cbb3-type cytochrome oxidase assembly protein CcoS [Planctomycetota bacterium]
MSVLFIALPVAIALGGLAMWACVRAIRSGQYDDLQSPSVRMLIDDESDGDAKTGSF